MHIRLKYVLNMSRIDEIFGSKKSLENGIEQLNLVFQA